MKVALAPVVLAGPRVALRVVEACDADALFALHADPEAMRYWSTPPWTDRAQAVRTIDEGEALRDAGSAMRFVVTKDERVIGACSLFAVQAASRRADVGYILAREHWGRGLMSEALGLVVAHAFGALDLNRLEADIDPRNVASGRLLERLGFAKEGHLRERWIVAGEVSDTALYGLLRREWRGSVGAAGPGVRPGDGPQPAA